MQGLLEVFFIQAGGLIPSQTRGGLVRIFVYLYQLIFLKIISPPPIFSLNWGNSPTLMEK